MLRFVQPEQPDTAPAWHGVVRHVQSREELRFTQIEEALQFINRYVTLERETGGEPAGEEA